jgi:MFS family permease
MSRLRAWLSENQLLVVASLVYAAVLAVLALVRDPLVATIALIPAGTAWMTVLSNANAAVQMFLPAWVRARGLAAYQIVFFGGQGVGAFLWGLVAERVGLVAAFLAAAAITAAGAATVRFWPMIDINQMDREPAVYWPEPRLAAEPDPRAGPVAVIVAYTVRPDNQREFLAAMNRVRRSRLRTGAVQWGIFRDGEIPDRMVEVYVVPTWAEHLRQHTGRLTGTDQEIEQAARALSDGPPQVTHLLPADVS